MLREGASGEVTWGPRSRQRAQPRRAPGPEGRGAGVGGCTPRRLGGSEQEGGDRCRLPGSAPGCRALAWEHRAGSRRGPARHARRRAVVTVVTSGFREPILWQPPSEAVPGSGRPPPRRPGAVGVAGARRPFPRELRVGTSLLPIPCCHQTPRHHDKRSVTHLRQHQVGIQEPAPCRQGAVVHSVLRESLTRKRVQGLWAEC